MPPQTSSRMSIGCPIRPATLDWFHSSKIAVKIRSPPDTHRLTFARTEKYGNTFNPMKKLEQSDVYQNRCATLRNKKSMKENGLCFTEIHAVP